MHDILEGMGPYDVKLVLNSLIEQKHLTLDTLNYRITSFDYGFVIKVTNRQSAAQLWCLLRLLLTMTGDLIPMENKKWKLLLLLLLCMEFIFSPSLTVAATRSMKNITPSSLSSILIYIYGQKQKLGPLMQLWAMRFEAKHGFFTTGQSCHMQLPKYLQNHDISASVNAVLQFPMWIYVKPQCRSWSRTHYLAGQL